MPQEFSGYPMLVLGAPQCLWMPPQCPWVLRGAVPYAAHLLLPCSLGLVLPPYSTYYIQANLSDQILQVKCK